MGQPASLPPCAGGIEDPSERCHHFREIPQVSEARVLGVATPFALGRAVSAWILPDRSVDGHAFLGATLTATSVGITARVLQDLGHSQTREARVIYPLSQVGKPPLMKFVNVSSKPMGRVSRRRVPGPARSLYGYPQCPEAEPVR
jgi:sodium/hydrogen exchanger family protein